MDHDARPRSGWISRNLRKIALRRHRDELIAGKVRPAILLWALGVPIPLVLLFLLIRGCV